MASRPANEDLTLKSYAYVEATLNDSMPGAVGSFMARAVAALKNADWLVSKWSVESDLPGDPLPLPRKLTVYVHRNGVYTTDDVKAALVNAFNLAGKTLTDVTVTPGYVPTSIDTTKVVPKTSNVYWWVFAALAGLGAVGYAAHWVDTHKPDRYGRLIPTR